MSRTRAKGTEFENRALEVLATRFPNAKRLPLNSPLGDLDNLPIVMECKNQQAMTLADWMNQAAKSGERAGKMYAVIHKRRGKNAFKAYVTQELDGYTEVLYGYQRYLKIIDKYPELA